MPEPTLSLPLHTAKLICNGIAFEEVVHGGGFEMPRHCHDEAHMAFLCEGRIDNFNRNANSTVAKSALLFMPPGETHATRYSDSVHAFYVAFGEQWWERVPGGAAQLDTVRAYQNDVPSWLAMRMYREFHKRDDLTPFMLEGLAMELLVAMSREKRTADRSTPRWLRQTQEYLHAHFQESLSVSEVAIAVGVHPGHLMRGFRQQYHDTIGDYVRKLRVEKACALMAESGHTLAEIAFAVGFSDQSHFSRTFKEVTGMTPTQWQNASGHVRSIQNMLG